MISETADNRFMDRRNFRRNHISARVSIKLPKPHRKPPKWRLHWHARPQACFAYFNFIRLFYFHGFASYLPSSASELSLITRDSGHHQLRCRAEISMKQSPRPTTVVKALSTERYAEDSIKKRKFAMQLGS